MNMYDSSSCAIELNGTYCWPCFVGSSYTSCSSSAGYRHHLQPPRAAGRLTGNSSSWGTHRILRSRQLWGTKPWILFMNSNWYPSLTFGCMPSRRRTQRRTWLAIAAPVNTSTFASAFCWLKKPAVITMSARSDIEWDRIMIMYRNSYTSRFSHMIVDGSGALWTCKPQFWGNESSAHS